MREMAQDHVQCQQPVIPVWVLLVKAFLSISPYFLSCNTPCLN